MNKKLLAVAIGAALVSAPMFANAAVTVYGAAHLSVDSLDNGNVSDNTLLTLSNNSSFIGFKAEDDIGGGTKAIAGFEWQIGLDNATTGMANRNTYAGLTGGFGTVRIGNVDDVMKQVGRKVDLFMSEQLGESRSITRQNTAGTLEDWDARMANGVNYDSPSLGGAVITLNYGMANNSTASTASDLTQMAAGVQYTGGPLYVGASYKTVDIDGGAVKNTANAIRASVSYTFGFGLTIAGLYQQVTDSLGVTGADRDTMGVGVAYAMGSHKIKAQYYQAGDTGAITNGATLMAVGYDYSMSKATTVYVTYASVENDPAGVYQVVSGSGHANPVEAGFATTAAGNKGTGISLGMKTAF